MPSVEILNSHSVKTLRDEIAKSNAKLGVIKGYFKSGSTKAQIVADMMAHKSRFHHIKMAGKKVRVVKTKAGGAVVAGAEASAADIAKYSTAAPKKPRAKKVKKTETVEFVAKNPPPPHDVKFEAKKGSKGKEARARKAPSALQLAARKAFTDARKAAAKKKPRPEMIAKITEIASRLSPLQIEARRQAAQNAKAKAEGFRIGGKKVPKKEKLGVRVRARAAAAAAAAAGAAEYKPLTATKADGTIVQIPMKKKK